MAMMTSLSANAGVVDQAVRRTIAAQEATAKAAMAARSAQRAEEVRRSVEVAKAAQRSETAAKDAAMVRYNGQKLADLAKPKAPRIIANDVGAGVRKNAINGKVGEALVRGEVYAQGGRIVATQPTAKIGSLTRRPDYVAIFGGQATAIEVKTGGAVKTANQVRFDAQMATDGALFRGKNAGTLHNQVQTMNTATWHK
jgi:hypothetical protein